GLIDFQSYGTGGSSCGVAALNFIEIRAGLLVPQWKARQSAKFRDSMIQDFLLYHLIARKKNRYFHLSLGPPTGYAGS
ncbi:hypothetical protein R3P38DRAFT_2587549, partial [Favolaschia claudopus]